MIKSQGVVKVKYEGMTPRQRVQLFDDIINGRIDLARVTDKMQDDAEAYYDLRISTMTKEMQENWTDLEREAHYVRIPPPVGDLEQEEKERETRVAKRRAALAKEIVSRKARRKIVLSLLEQHGPQTLAEMRRATSVYLGLNFNGMVRTGLVKVIDRRYPPGKTFPQAVYEITEKGLDTLKKERNENGN